jgi:4-methyl-5(b-hydroxyethyl)-thiazole monophosphate biosynthesis
MKTVLVPLAENFEEIEAISIIDILRRADLNVTTAALGESLQVKGAHGITVHADAKWADVGAATYDAIVLPGGPAYQTLMAHEGVLAAVRRHNDAGKVTSAICASPAVLAHAGVIKGKRVSCYPSVEEEVAKVAKLTQRAVVVDGNIVTSRGPSTAVAFAIALIGEIVSVEKSRAIAADVLLAD